MCSLSVVRAWSWLPHRNGNSSRIVFVLVLVNNSQLFTNDRSPWVLVYVVVTNDTVQAACTITIHTSMHLLHIDKVGVVCGGALERYYLRATEIPPPPFFCFECVERGGATVVLYGTYFLTSISLVGSKRDLLAARNTSRTTLSCRTSTTVRGVSIQSSWV